MLGNSIVSRIIKLTIFSENAIINVIKREGQYFYFDNVLESFSSKVRIIKVDHLLRQYTLSLILPEKTGGNK